MSSDAKPSRSFRSAVAARQMAAADEQLQTLIETVADLIFRLDANGRFVEWKGCAGDELVVPPERFLGKHFSEALPDPLASQLGQLTSAARRFGTLQKCEYETKGADGASRWYEARAKATSNGDVLIVCRNISDMRRVQDSLRASEQSYRDLIELAPDAIGIIQDGRAVYLNSAAAKLMGVADLGQLMGLALNDHVHADDVASVNERQRAIIEEGVKIPPHDVLLRRLDGSYVPVEVCSGPCQFNGRPAIQLIARNVADRRAVEELARKQAAFLEALIRTAAEGVCVFTIGPDNRLKFTVWNQHMVQISGYTMDEVNGLGWMNVAFPSDTPREAIAERIARLRRGEHLSAAERAITRKDGERRIVSVSTSQIEADDGESAMVAIIQDITERKRAIDAIADSENRLRAIFDAEPECVKVVSIDGQLLSINPAGLAMLEADSIEEARRQSLFDYILPQYRDAFAELHQRVVRSGEAGTLQFQIQGLKGTERWMDTHAVPLRDQHGKIEAQLGITRDITKQRRAEEALRDSEQRFRCLSDSAFEGLMIHEQGLIVDANQACAELFGFREAAEILGKTCLETIALTEESRAIVREQLRNPRDRVFEIRAYRPDGRIRILETQGRDLIYRGRRGRVVALRDVTERSERDHALRMFRTLIDHSTDAIEVIEPESGRFLDVNLRACMDLGYSREEMLGLDVVKIDPGVTEEGLHRTIRRLRESGAHKFESVHRRKDGSTFPVEVNLKLVTLEREYLVSVVRDITDRKLAEEERRKLEQQMLHAQKLESLGVLAGGVAHDFNNLLTAVLINANLAAMALPDDSPVQRMLGEIQQTTERAADLTRQMLAYSGRGKFVVGLFSLDELVKDMQQFLLSVISKKASLVWELEPASVEGDATQMRQVVMNLVTNASDAMGGGCGQIVVRTGMRRAKSTDLESPFLPETPPEGDYAILEVEDNGCGMDEATCDRVFEPFFSTKFVGRGLGLATVLGVVRGHRGTVKVATRPGHGTTFSVLIPAVTAHSDTLATDEPVSYAVSAASQRAAAPPSQPLRNGSGVVLVVDDEEAIGRLISSTLALAGFQPVHAGDGMSALEVFSATPTKFTAILLDLTMPRMDGVETLRELRRLSPDIPVLVMSGYSEHDMTSQFAGLHPSGFLQKPLNPRELVDRICDLIQARSR